MPPLAVPPSSCTWNVKVEYGMPFAFAAGVKARLPAVMLATVTTWPAVTDCDRLDQAFAALNARGIIALQNAGYTQSDGYGDISQSYDERTSTDMLVAGYTYTGVRSNSDAFGRGHKVW